MLIKGLIEGLHDAIRTYTRAILPRRLVSFLFGEVHKKQQKTLEFWFTSQNDLEFPPSVCSNILATLLKFSIVVWTK